MYKLALSAGHGINTPGKRCLKSIDCSETREWVLNDRICAKISEKLKNYNEIEIMRVDDESGISDVPIARRAAKANSYNADLYLSIHHNAGISGKSGGGIMVFTYLTVDMKTAELQKLFYNEAVKTTGLKGNRSAPLGKQNLGECRMTKMPAILIECGFMDSTTDTPVILTNEFAEGIAQACVNVILKQSGATEKVYTADKEKASEIIYRVRKSYNDTDSQIGAFSVPDNAISAAKNAKCNVYDTSGKCIWSYNEYALAESCEQKKAEDFQQRLQNENSISNDILFQLKNILNSIVSFLSIFNKEN